MGRFTDMDDDATRLPEGMQRIGYDADTERYTFRDQDGSLWESAPGNRYGELRPVGQQSSVEDVEAMNVMIEEDQQSALRKWKLRFDLYRSLGLRRLWLFCWLRLRGAKRVGRTDGRLLRRRQRGLLRGHRKAEVKI